MSDVNMFAPPQNKKVVCIAERRWKEEASSEPTIEFLSFVLCGPAPRHHTT